MLGRYDRLKNRDGDGCHYCGRAFGEEKLNRRTLDHKIPRSAGGNNNEDNLVLACARCNVLKGSKNYEFFKMNLPKILAQLETLSSPKVRKVFIKNIKSPRLSAENKKYTLEFSPEKAYQMACEHYKKYGKRGLTRKWIDLIEGDL